MIRGIDIGGIRNRFGMTDENYHMHSLEVIPGTDLTLASDAAEALVSKIRGLLQRCYEKGTTPAPDTPVTL